ncbi:MAG TPA: hypothetical protein VF006_33845 [Longimicrobium sp.]
MGYAVSWFAVSGKEPEQVLQELGLTPAGETEEVPEAPIVCATLPAGWFLVFSNRTSPLAFSVEPLPALSAGCRVVFCQVEEHTMFSSAACYQDGRRVWHVAHDADKGIYHLETEGELPPEFEGIFRSMKSEQDQAGGEKADVDYIIDVPIELAKAIAGFRHDEDVAGADVEPFRVLEHTTFAAPSRPSTDPPTSRSWWRFW